MKSIKQIRQDARVYEVEINSSYDPNYPDTNSKYLVNLKDGFVFDDGTHVAGANTVKELNELLNEIEEEATAKTEAKQKAKMKNLDLEKQYKMIDSLKKLKDESDALAFELYMQIKNDTIYEKIGRLISILSGRNRQAFRDYMTTTIERLKKGESSESIITEFEKLANVTIYIKQSEKKATSKFELLRQQSGMNLTEFSKYFGIPYRTVQNWERGERECPEYLLDLMKYKLEKEKIM